MKDKLVIITGASRGIGQAIAEECARRGARLALSARNGEELECTAETIRKSVANAVLITQICDVSDALQVEALFARAKKQYGPAYGVVCAAGVLGEVGPLESSDLRAWEKTIQVNLLGSMYCAHFAIPQMRENGGGHIVLFSGGGQGPQARRTAYTASKGGIWRFTESLGAELLEQKIYVNAIAPGAVNTKFLEDVLAAGEDKAGKQAFEEAMKQKKSGGTPPTKAAALAAWLLSEKSSGLSGKVLSALWDDYENFTALERMSASDIFTFKRVVTEQGSTRP